MNVDETLESAEAMGTTTVAGRFSAAWWESRSTDELRDMMRRGFGSEQFAGATAEVERRARAQMKAQDEASETHAAGNKRLRRLILEGVLLACLISLILLLFMR